MGREKLLKRSLAGMLAGIFIANGSFPNIGNEVFPFGIGGKTQVVKAENVQENSITITFNANGGTVSDSSKIVQVGSLYGELPTPKRGGYVFQGWYTSPQDGTMVLPSSTVLTGQSHTLYAHWKPAGKKTLIYDPAGGIMEEKTKQVQIGSLYGTLEKPVREGYIFKGWYTEDGILILSSSVVMGEEDITLYAHWERDGNAFNISYDSNGGTLRVLEKLVMNGSVYGELPVPNREGYHFAGWYTEKEEGHQITSSTIVNLTADQTLYAHWTPETHLLIFDGNGGVVNVASKNVVYGGKYGELPVPEKSGFSFVGWYTDKTGGISVTQETISDLMENQTLYARWAEESCQVSFDGNGGSVELNNKNIVKDGVYGTLPIGIREGYGFLGWFTEPEGGEQVTSSTKVEKTENHTLYAHWQIASCTINFETNGGSVETDCITVSRGEKYGTLPKPTKKGYYFVGWYTGKSSGKKISEEDIVNENQTLYAHWQMAYNQLSLESVSYNIGNDSGSFAYPEQYKIPLGVYRYMFGDTERAKTYYNNESTWRGNCFGMCSTAIMFNVDSNEINIEDYNSLAQSVSDLTIHDKSSKLQITLEQFVEAMQISQKDSTIIQEYYKNKDDLKKLCTYVKNSENQQGYPLLIAMFGKEGGHAVVGYKIIGNKLYVYDPNYPNVSRYITLETDSDGNYTKWSYRINDGYEWGSGKEDCWITYIPYEEFYRVWSKRGGNQNASLNLLKLNTKNAIIYDEEGNVAAELKDGKVVTNKEDVQQVLSVELGENSTDGCEVYLPTATYLIENKDEQENFTASMVNVNLSASVTTSSDKIRMAIDDSRNLSDVNIELSEGQKYNINLASSFEYDNESISVDGTGQGYSVGVSQKKGDVKFYNCQGSDIKINGEQVKYLELRASAGDGGRISPEGVTNVLNGETRTYQITPEEGYMVEDVLVDGVSVGAVDSYTFPEISGNHNISATFISTDISDAEIEDIPNQIYTGENIKPVIRLKKNGKYLKEVEDYSVDYYNNKNVGSASVTITGKGKYSGRTGSTFEIVGGAGQVFTFGKYKYEITDDFTDDGEVTFIGMTSSKVTKIVIPDAVEIGNYSYAVTSIQSKSMKNYKKLKSVEIGQKVKTIGTEAFCGDEKLTNIVIKGNSLSKAGKNCLKKINKKAKIKVPAKKLSAYKKLFKGKGQPKNVKMIKINKGGK